jgi:hypothetical protein
VKPGERLERLQLIRRSVAENWPATPQIEIVMRVLDEMILECRAEVEDHFSQDD